VASGKANGEDGVGISVSELRKALRCVRMFAGEDKGEGVVIELLASEACSARGLQNRSSKSALGRRFGALGRLREGILAIVGEC